MTLFLKYPKINTLFKRDSKGFITDEYSHKEFDQINYWQVQEKIHGTNIRIHWDGENVYFGGRTDNAELPTKLLMELQRIFTVDKIKEIIPEGTKVTFFGEGYGSGIQAGGNYRLDQGFILFDINIGSFWLRRLDLEDMANKLSIPIVPLIADQMCIEDIIDYVKNKPLSSCSINEQIAEGIVAKTDLLLRNGTRLWFKLKVKDFRK